MLEFFSKLLNTTDFPARWHCGHWTAGHGWLHVLSDLGVWSAYVAIPCVLGYFLLKRKDLPFKSIFLLFGAFILACGTTHLMEAIIFWWPAYRLAGLIKLFTAAVSWATVVALIPVAPKAMAMRSLSELEKEIEERMRAEKALRDLHAELETRVQMRTADLERANAALQKEIEQRVQVEETLREQRERFRVTLASIGDAVIVTDTVGRVTFMNSVAQTLTGWTPEEAQNEVLESIYRVIDAGTGEPLESPSKIVSRESAISGTRINALLIAKDESKRHVEEMAAPIRGRNAALEGMVLVFRDITDRKRDEQEIKESETRFRSLADSMPQLAWSTRPDGYIVWYNKRWYDYTGTKPEEMEGWNWQSVHDSKELPRVMEKWQAALASAEPWEDTFPLRRHDGAMRWHLSRAVPVKDEAGHVVRWFGTNTDITEHLEMERALKDADRRKNEFLATLAHELRNPLSPISYALTLWPMVKQDPEKTEELRAIMERQVQHMIRLIDDLMDVSRITRGKIKLRLQTVDLSALVSGAVEANQPFITECEHDLTVLLPSELVLLQGDAARLTQVLGNILHNAAKYTGKKGKILVSAERVDDWAVIKIKDNGPGIPTEMLTEIFEMFRQVDQTIDRSFGGLGIGLTLAKRLVEMHGGRIEARSAGQDQGSEFIVSLPALRQVPTTAGSNLEAMSRKPSTPSCHVLVVDDARESANMLALMLKTMGQEVHVVYDGQAGIRYIAEHHPKIAFIDIAMPGLNGYEVVRRIRGEESGKLITLVAVTGYGQDEDRAKALDAGFDHHLTKPVNMEVMARLLNTITSG